MAHNWTPTNTLTPWFGEYHMHDRGTKIAIIREVEIRRPQGRLWRSVTAEAEPSKRTLIGYFPTLEMAAAVTWRVRTERQKPADEVTFP